MKNIKEIKLIIEKNGSKGLPNRFLLSDEELSLIRSAINKNTGIFKSFIKEDVKLLIILLMDREDYKTVIKLRFLCKERNVNTDFMDEMYYLSLISTGSKLLVLHLFFIDNMKLSNTKLRKEQENIVLFIQQKIQSKLSVFLGVLTAGVLFLISLMTSQIVGFVLLILTIIFLSPLVKRNIQSVMLSFLKVYYRLFKLLVLL